MKSFQVIFCSIFLALAGTVASEVTHASEFDTYRYKLTVSKDDKVCKHMEQVYNTRFTRPHDHRDVTGIAALRLQLPPPEKDDLRLYRLKGSFHPTSPEFEMVKWGYRTYESTDAGPKPMIVTEIDIDNDGKKETVVKSQFHDGSANGFENLRVFRLNEIDLEAKLTSRYLALGRDGVHPPRYIGDPALLRPFIYQNATYLHIYNYFHPEPGIKGGTYDPPETLSIRKYRSGGNYLPDFTPAAMEDICQFEMTIVNK